MNRKLIRLTEADLHKIVIESVNKLLKEEEYYTDKVDVGNNYNDLYNELRKYGINTTQKYVKDDELNKVFGFEPTKYKYLEYGIHEISCRPYNTLYANIYNGSFYSNQEIYTRDYFMHNHLNGHKNKRIMTEKEKKAIVDFFIKLINKKKEQVVKNQYYIEHFEELLENYLQIVKQYLNVLSEKDKENYDAYLTKGNSYSDKRVTSSIVITNDGYQVGYIKIFQDKTLGDIELDCCYLGGGHTHWTMKDPSNPQKDIEYACRMAT